MRPSGNLMIVGGTGLCVSMHTHGLETSLVHLWHWLGVNLEFVVVIITACVGILVAIYRFGAGQLNRNADRLTADLNIKTNELLDGIISRIYQVRDFCEKQEPDYFSDTYDDRIITKTAKLLNDQMDIEFSGFFDKVHRLFSQYSLPFRKIPELSPREREDVKRLAFGQPLEGGTREADLTPEEWVGVVVGLIGGAIIGLPLLLLYWIMKRQNRRIKLLILARLDKLAQLQAARSGAHRARIIGYIMNDKRKVAVLSSAEPPIYANNASMISQYFIEKR
jgi:hypothetical protein